MKFTDRNIKALEAPDPSGKQTLYWNQGNATPGLGILVSGTTSSKSWIVQANLPSGKSRRVTIGPVAVFTVSAAWVAAKPKLMQMLDGQDPKLSGAERAVAGMTVSEVLEDYIADNPNLRPQSIVNYRGIAKCLGPLLTRPMREIEAADAAERFKAIPIEVAERRAAGKSRGSVNVNGHGSANVALTLLGTLWQHQTDKLRELKAYKDKNLGHNPVRGGSFCKKWHALDRRERRIETEDLPKFYSAVLNLENDIQRDVVRLALLTGMRANEVSGLKWSEVKLTDRMFEIPAPRMKGKKMFKLPMSDIVHDILVWRRANRKEGEYVFWGCGKSGHCESFPYALTKIAKQTGIRVSQHDLRRTYASIAGVCPIPPVALKMLLSHSTKGDVTFGYQILNAGQLREAAQIVADRIKQLCEVSEPVGENVARLA
jgi:integrase